MRDQLRKAIRKNITKSGQAAEHKKKWKYEDSMSFVIPFFKERETQSNIGEPDSLSDGSNDEHEGMESVVITGDTSEKNSNNNINQKCTASPKKSSSRYSLNKRKFEKTETASSVLMKYLVESDKQETKATANDHPIDIFFNSLAATVKTFSPEYQHIAKSKLFNVVSELEWAHLQSKNTNYQVPTSINFPAPDNRSNTHPIPFFQTQNVQQAVYPQQQIYEISRASNSSTPNDSFMSSRTQTPSPVSSGRSSAQSYFENVQPNNF